MRYEQLIRQLPLFTQLPDEYMEWIREACRLMRVDPGEYVFRQGDVARGLYMMVTGEAVLVRQLPDGRMQELAVVRPGQYLNEQALFREGQETASLEVTQTATVLLISRDLLWRIVSYHPELKHYLPIPVEAAQDMASKQVFKGQRESEKILLDIRRHWWAFARRFWLPLLLMGVAFGVAAVLPIAFLSLVVAGFFGVVIPGTMMVYYYLEWRNDHVIITDQRIIRIHQIIHSFKTDITEVPLSSVQQINADIVTADIFSRIFNYGTVEIRTAGDAGNIRMTLMPDPEGIQALIFQNRDRHQANQESETRNVIRAEIDQILKGKTAPQQTKTEGRVVTRQTGFNTPFQTRFINEKGETIYRKHVIYWLRGIWLPAVLMLSTVVFFFVLIFGGGLGLGILGYLLDGILFLFAAGWIYWVDWDWRNDMYIVGDEMIKIIHKRPLWFQNEEDQILVERIDNVASFRNGFFRTLLNYGDVKISLLGGDKGDEKWFVAIPRPQDVQAEITRRQQRQRNKKEAEAERKRREEIAEYLAVYHETVQGEHAAQSAPQIDPDISPLIPTQSSSVTPPPHQQRPPRRLPRNRPSVGNRPVRGVRPPSVPNTKQEDE
ncbi:MAG: hypothetical protein Kow00117_19480 [Phototrophicales bacterium]